LTLQALEMDADAYSAITRLEVALGTLRNREGDSAFDLKETPDAYPTWPAITFDSAIYMFCLIQEFFFRVYGTKFDPARVRTARHPNPICRSLMAKRSVMLWMIGRFPQIYVTRYAEIAKNSMYIAHDATVKLHAGEQPPQLDQMLEALRSGAVAAHIRLLDERWAAIRADVLQHSYLKNAAP
jgi:hypothetical protein